MFQDIRQPRRSLKEILPGRQTPISRAKKAPVEESVESEDLKINTYSRFTDPPRAKRSGLLVFFIVLIIAVVGVVALSSIISRAKVIVTPKTAELVFDKTVVNYSSAESMIFLPVSLSVSLTATGEEKVSEKASGSVVIYNNFSTASQKLVATTRLESKTGKIYRLVEAVTVPGQKTVGGKVTPGSVEAQVIADVAGESYNSEPTDFTIPGFKGSPRYDKFYARSKTSLAGGFVGTRPKVAEADKNKALKALHESLIKKVLSQSRAQIPKGFILYDNAATFEFTDQLVAGTSTSSNKAKITSTINGSAYLLEEERLVNELLKSQPNNLSELKVTMPELRNFEVVMSSATQATSSKDKLFKLTITGKTKAIAQVDEVKLAASLVDKAKSEAGVIFNEVAEIQTAKVSLFPPWLRRFPQDAGKIKIELLTP